MKATNHVPAPALKYHGGKWILAPWIISHFPPHTNYLEPCGGAASVLLQKPRSELETYNDVDHQVVSYFQVLRDSPDELVRRIKLTPWARTELQLGFVPCDDPIENARRFFAVSWMSLHGGVPEKTGRTWRHNKHARDRYTLAVWDMQRIADALRQVARRFIGVQIENRDALDVIRRYDNQDTLVYFDPPYVASTRSHRDTYRFEVDQQFHSKAARALHSCRGYVVVSGYACRLYDDLYRDWIRKDRAAQGNSGSRRTESIWLSPRTAEAISGSASSVVHGGARQSSG
jgi:DNA adenine methylase